MRDTQKHFLLNYKWRYKKGNDQNLLETPREEHRRPGQTKRILFSRLCTGGLSPKWHQPGNGSHLGLLWAGLGGPLKGWSQCKGKVPMVPLTSFWVQPNKTDFQGPPSIKGIVKENHVVGQGLANFSIEIMIVSISGVRTCSLCHNYSTLLGQSTNSIRQM